MMKKLVFGFLVVLAAAFPAFAQTQGNAVGDLVSKCGANNPIFGTGSAGTAAGVSCTGTLAVGQGGTSLVTITAHDFMIGNGTSAPNLLAPSSTSGVPVISQGASADPVYGTAVIAGGGTGATTAASAFSNLAPTPTRAGDIVYWNGTSWVTLAGNNSGTQFLQETSSGVPSWAPETGTGTVTSITCFGIAITTTGTCTTTGQLPGSTGTTVASAGNIGEVISATVVSGSAVTLTTATPANVASISLTAGHWQITGLVCFNGGSSTSITRTSAWTSSVSATQPTPPNGGAYVLSWASFTLSSGNDSDCMVAGSQDVYLSGATTYYLSTQDNFSISSLAAYGVIRGLRVQ